MAGENVKLAVRNVSKSFRIRGRRENQDRILHVLGDVSFDVRQGEIVSLIGESGCGKTTLLKIIQGLIRLDGGTILVDGVPVSKPGRDRGFVFQHASLLPWRNALHNVEFGLELQGVPARRGRNARGTFSDWWDSEMQPISTPTSFRVECSSASAWRGRWPLIRRSC